MEWFWDVLNCEPTKEIHIIKQAYVNQVKQYKQLEIKNELTKDAYEQLDKAEKAAISFVEAERDNASSGAEQHVFREGQSSASDVTPPLAAVKDPPVIKKEAHKDEKAFLEKIGQLKEQIKEIKPETQVKAKDNGDQQAKRPQDRLIVDQIRTLLNKWPNKVELPEWHAIFTEKSSWGNVTLMEVRDNSLPLIKAQLHLLPKEILCYLYEELNMSTIDLADPTHWSAKIANLPDFSFDNAFYIPEDECTTYFTHRNQLYQNIMADDWSSRRMAIDKQITYFTAGDDWRGDYDIHDQDVFNLIVAYDLKTNIELFVKDPKAPWLDEKLLLPINAPLASEKNQTAKYLRLLFTAYRKGLLSAEQALFIEDQDHNYFDHNLHVLLLGLAFYRLNDRVKAEKYFGELTNNYSNLLKKMLGKPKEVPLRSIRTAKKKTTKSFKFDGKTIMRLVILIAVGIGLLSNLFSDTEDYNDNSYDYDGEEELYDEEEYSDLEYPDELDLGFVAYFFNKEERPDSYDRQNAYMERYVGEDVQHYFEDYRDNYEQLVIDQEGEVKIHYARIDKETEAYLFSDQQQQDVILYVKDETLISRVIGEYWEEIDIAEYNALLKVFKLTPEDVQEVLSQSYFLLPAERRVSRLTEIRNVVSPEVYDMLDEAIFETDDLDFVEGSYQISHNQSQEVFLLFNNKAGELQCVLTLDEYGQVIAFDSSGLLNDEDPEILKNAGEKRPLKRLQESD